MAARNSSRALMEKVVFGIKIKVVGFVISMIIIIYLTSTIDVEALIEAEDKEHAKNDKKARMGNDSWILDPGLILRDSINLIPGPKYLPLATKKPGEKDTDEVAERKAHAAGVKSALITGNLFYLFIWTAFDAFVIYRLQIYAATL
ncbi:uncharacterized protein [Dermacentor andersoni]|uniref:uncharacterized protein isoform X2 n=1 Tax=Dermacentor andersoni TaxID=34620 RepID=UPI0024166742|nr:uncharacterized protein LOC129380698 isoform X2 [Dermacentor andersoni]